MGGAWLLVGLLVMAGGAVQAATENEGSAGAVSGAAESVVAVPSAKKALYIGEYRVKGVHALTPLEIETAVYPFLGPERTEDDVKAACAALEKLYRDKGYSAATVQYSAQVDKGGVIHLQASEGTIAKLRVKGSRYFTLSKIKAAAPSLAEGKAINFNEVNRDMIALNQLADRRVTPSLKPGVEPGTYDVDLDVKDTAPVHGSVEVNNRASPNTKPLRVNVSVSDNNLWQAGHSIGFSFQVAPQRRQDSEVLTGYYLARFAGLEHTSFMLQGTKQDSNISTLGGTTVAGPGQTLEAKTMLTLPTGKDWSTGKDWENFYHSLSFGIAYKHYKQTVNSPGSTDTSSTGKIVTPITYFPVSVDYTATATNLTGKGSVTDFSAGVTFGLRGLGSGPSEFNLNRYGADGNFLTFRSDLSHTQELPLGLQLFGKIQGQLANQPLVSSEEFSGGGQSTVRGYLEAEAVGDNGAFATIELRSPSLFSLWKKKGAPKAPADVPDAKPGETNKIGEWRIYVFGDAGGLTLYDSLSGQQARFVLSSFGAGTSLSLGNHFSGTLDAGYPLNSQSHTQAHDLHLTFRASLNY